MKKIFVLAMLSSLVACNNEDVLSVDNIQDNVKISSIRSLEEAKQIALDATNMLNPNKARSANRVLDSGNIKIITEASSRNSESVNDTLMYIINYEDNAGFAVISANPNTEALLAVTEEGYYDSNIQDCNNGFDIFMNMAKNYVYSTNVDRPELPGGNSDFEVLTQMELRNDTTEIARKFPLISTRWGQTGCEGQYTSNGYSGCANTLMAQIMSYYNYPTSINITYPNATVNTVSLNWYNMKLHNIKHTVQSCTANDEAHSAIGHLHRQLGYLTNSEYKVDGTSTEPDSVVTILNELGFSVPTLKDYNFDNIYNDISSGKPVFIAGYDDIYSPYLVGHGWIADGYLKYRIKTTEWRKKITETEWTLSAEYEPFYRSYLHMNWGWDGNCNGYFLSNVFSPNNAEEYDNQGEEFDNSSIWNFDYWILYAPVSL